MPNRRTRRGFTWRQWLFLLAIVAAMVAGAIAYNRFLTTMQDQAMLENQAAYEANDKFLAPFWNLHEKCQKLTERGLSVSQVERAIGLKPTPVPVGRSATYTTYQVTEPVSGGIVILSFDATGLMVVTDNTSPIPLRPRPAPPAALANAPAHALLACAVLALACAAALLLALTGRSRPFASTLAILLALGWLAFAFTTLLQLGMPRFAVPGGWRAWDASLQPLVLARDLAFIVALPAGIIVLIASLRKPPAPATPAASDPPPDTLSAPPDWSAIQRDMLCPMCEYNLRGLANPRCPECGYPFSWAELLRSRSQWVMELFEHARRPVRAFWRTICRTLRPGSFFRQLPAADVADLPRLLISAIVIIAAAFTPAIILNLGELLPTLPVLKSTALALDRAVTPLDTRLYQNYWSNLIFRWVRADSVGIAFGVFGTGWAVMSLLMLLAIPRTVARAGMRFSHLLRCIIYSTDILVWIAPLSLPLFLTGMNGDFALLRLAIAFLAIAAAATMFWRQFQAARYYLRLPQAPLVVALLQFAVAVGSLILILILSS